MDTSNQATCPWKGLSSYDTADGWLFVGRDRDLARLQRAALSASLCGVIGASGSGKSSLIFAGLLGRREGTTPYLSMRPGPRPMVRLGEIQQQLRLVPTSAKAVFVVDQLEEIFTQCDDDSERAQFLNELCDIAKAGKARVVVALRSDHYGACALHPRFAEELSQSHVLLGNLREQDFRQIVEGPAKACQLVLEPTLAELIVDDVGGEPGALPLLSHALRETWARRAGQVLTVQGYQDAGGVRGAIARSAETAWLELPEAQKDHARTILVRLAAPGSVAFDTGRSVSLLDLVRLGDVEAQAALESLIRTRIVTVDSGTARIAHEAVFREWPRLRAWLEADRAVLRSIVQMEENAAAWVESGRDRSALYRGARLQAVVDLGIDTTRLDGLSGEFLGASLDSHAASQLDAAARVARQRQTNRRLRGLLSATIVGLAVAATAGFIALQKRNDSEQQRKIADARRLAAASVSVRTDQLDLAALLAVESRRHHDDLDTRGSLFAALTDRPGLQYYIPHPDTVIDAVLDPTGRYLANNGQLPAAIEVWDLNGPIPVRSSTIELGEKVEEYRMQFLTGGRILVGDDSGGMRIVDQSTGKQLMRSAVAHDGAVWAVAITSDEHTLISGGDDGLIRVVDATNGNEVHKPLETDGVGIQTTELSPDGTILATGGDGGALHFWDVATWTQIGQPVSVSSVWSLAWSPDGKQFAVGTDAALEFYDYETRTKLGPSINAHDGTVYRIRYVGAGTEVVTSGEDGHVNFWDASTHQPTRPPLIGHASGARFAVNEASKRLVTGSDDGRVAVWDLQGGGGIATAFPTPGGIAALAATPNGVVAAADAEGNLSMFDANGVSIGKPIHLTAKALTAVAIDDKATRVAVSSGDGKVFVVDPKSGKLVREPISAGSRSESVALSPDGRWLGVAQTDTKCLVCLEIHDLSNPSAPTIGLRSPGLKAGVKPVGNAITINRSGTRVATGNRRGWVDVWELPSGRHLWGAKLERGIRSVAFSADDKLVAAGANTGLLKLFNARTGAFAQQLRGHQGPVGGLAFSADSTKLASTSRADHSLRVWRLDNGLTFGRPVFTGQTVQLSPAWTDNSHVVAPHGTTGAMRYSIDPTQLEIAACALTQRNLTLEEWRQYLPGNDYRKTCMSPGVER